MQIFSPISIPGPYILKQLNNPINVLKLSWGFHIMMYYIIYMNSKKNTNKGFCVTESQRPAHKNIKIVTFKKLRVKIDRYYIFTRYIISHNEE